MFQTKKKKIINYLNEKNTANAKFSPFDLLLSDYISGELKIRMEEMDIVKPDIYIDWLPDYQCIGIQGKYRQYYVDLQVEPTEISIGCDPDEPDEHTVFPLESREQMYKAVKDILVSLK